MHIDRLRLRWGRPPLALVPAALAGRLAGAPLAAWVADLLDGPGTPVAALTVGAWERLPGDEVTRRRLRREVLMQVRTLVHELRPVPVGVAGRDGSGAPPPAEGPCTAGWTPRARAALAGARRSTGAGRPVTFGALVAVPGSGVATALEVTALLELQDLPHGPASPNGHGVTAAAIATVATPAAWPLPGPGPDGAGRDDGAGPDTSVPTAELPVLRWGRPGCALLPRSLRHALAYEPLPTAVAADLGLPPEATTRTLDERVWERCGGMAHRTETYLLALTSLREVRDLRVMDDSWPPDRRPEEVPWPKRLWHALVTADLLDPACLQRLTYGDLLRLPAVGKKSAVEFGVIADAVCVDRRGPVSEEERQAFLRAAAAPWSDRVHTADGRFADVLPPYGPTLRAMLEEAAGHPEGRLAHVLAGALPLVRARVDEVDAEPIDRALPRLAAGFGVSPRDLDVTADRLGWRRGQPRSFREAAAGSAISRERARQVVERTTERFDRARLDQVERAARLLADAAPIEAERAARLLADAGLSSRPLDPGAVQALAEATGYAAGFRVDHAGGTRLVLAATAADAPAIVQAARRAAVRTGTASLTRVLATLDGGRRPGTDVATVALVLRRSPGPAFLDAEWFWFPGMPPERDPLRVATRRMLSVTPRLHLDTVRGGLARRRRLVENTVAPLPILAAYYHAHPEFVVDGPWIEAAERLDAHHELRPMELVVVEALRATPEGRLSRPALRAAGAARGVTEESLDAVLITTPVLEHLQYGVWCLRGSGDAPPGGATAPS